MKTLLTALLFLVFVNSYSQEIVYATNKSWTEVLSLSASSGKPVFVDVYTTWCGPCKRMDAEVFTQPRVYQKMNTDFIDYKIDAEKGEGPAICKKYNVFTYPTYLFVNGKGVMVYRANGYMDPNEFIREANRALLEAKQPITVYHLDSLYAAKKMDMAMIYTYLKRRLMLKMESADLLDEYCKKLDTAQQGSQQTLKLIADEGSFLTRNLQIGKALEILVAHKDKFAALNADEDLDTYISWAQKKTMARAIKNHNDSLFRLVLKWNKGRDGEVFYEGQNDALALHYYYGIKNNKAYLAKAVAYIDKKIMTLTNHYLDSLDKVTYDAETAYINAPSYKGTPQEKKEEIAGYKCTQTIQVVHMINNISTNVAGITTDKALTAKCVQWMKRSVDLTERDTAYFRDWHPITLQLYAIALYRSGQKAKAIDVQQQAVALVSKGDAPTAKAYAEVLVKMKNGEKVGME